MPLDGHCACERVRIQLASEPLFVHCCHCTYCQRESGSAFVLNALIERDRVTVEGETHEVTVPTASGQGQRIARCTGCQTALFSHYAYGKLKDAVAFVRVGVLEPEHRMAPDIHIWTASKLPWVTLPSDVPVTDGYYRASEHWPEASLDRRAALFAALG